jgi:hypothetical protein
LVTHQATPTKHSHLLLQEISCHLLCFDFSVSLFIFLEDSSLEEYCNPCWFMVKDVSQEEHEDKQDVFNTEDGEHRVG